MANSAIEMLLRKERTIVVSGLMAIVLLAWLYLLTGAGTGMSPETTTSLQLFDRSEARMDGIAVWSASHFCILLAMWWMMMIAMMLPSAAPVVLLYGRVLRHGQDAGATRATLTPTANFVLGYLLTWLAFSAVATALQALLVSTGGFDSMMMWSTDRTLTAVFLLAAGSYQLSPLKSVCLDHCRTPVDSLTRNWRPGAIGALRMGLHHGLFCVGCCWLLMSLLFIGGVMNLIWIAGLSVLVLLEKLAPFGVAMGRAIGLFLIGGGAYALLASTTTAPI